MLPGMVYARLKTLRAISDGVQARHLSFLEEHFQTAIYRVLTGSGHFSRIGSQICQVTVSQGKRPADKGVHPIVPH